MGGIEVLEAAVRAGAVPGAVGMVLRDGRLVFEVAAGHAALEPEERPMQLDTVFDLASLTKPLATTPVILRLAEQGLLDLDAPITRYLPEFSQSAHRSITIRHLLTHTSGLPAWYPIYTGSDPLQTIAGLDLAFPTGTRVEYSCLGFITLGILAERHSGKALEVLVRKIFAPLGVDACFQPSLPPERFALTECGNRYEQESVRSFGLQFDGWREGYYPGEVHDGNAFYAMHGVSGNAGLFGTARDVAVLGQAWLEGRIAGPEIVRKATRDHTAHLEVGRGLGWALQRGAFSCGSRFSCCSYGHTGFTGTSIWIDPDRALVAVLLTNRVHPDAFDAQGIADLRIAFHDALHEDIQLNR